MELIKITEENGNRVVSAKELHQFLDAATRFDKWIKRMFEYDFVEHIDFQCLTKNVPTPNGGVKKALDDYALTIDCAKEIAMLQRTEKGKLARLYFIEMEKKAKEPVKNLPTDIEERLRLLEAKSITTEVTELTVFGFANMQRKKLYGSEAMTIGKRAAKRCRELRLPVNKVMDQRFG